MGVIEDTGPSQGAGPPAGPVAAFGYRQQLKRSLGLADLLVYGLLYISPTAPFATFGILYDASAGMVPLVYVIGFAAIAFTALSYMALAREFPLAGSAYTYAKLSFGDGAGFVAGWAVTLDYLLAPALIYLAAAVAINAVMPGVPLAVWAGALLVLNTLVNLRGIESVARANAALLALQVLAVALFLAFALAALVQGKGGAHLSLVPFHGSKSFAPGVVLGAASIGMLNYLGFDAISTLSEEAKGGASSVSKATMLSLLLTSAFFISESYLACLFVLGRPAFAPGIPSYAAFYDVAAFVGGSWLKATLSIAGVFLANVGAGLTAQAAVSRLFFSMARDGQLPRVLSRVSHRRGIPDRATLLVSALTLGLIVFFATRLTLLLTIVSFGALTAFLFVHASVVKHFLWDRRSRNWARHLLAPLIGFAVVALVIWGMDANAKIVGGCWMAVGLGVVMLRRVGGRTASGR